MKKIVRKTAAHAKAAHPKKVAAPARKKPVITEPPVVSITAKADIGFGNHLYLRGEGPGLSWDHGLAMVSIAADLWAATVKGATSPVTFKVLVNDLSWSSGDDYVVEVGQSVTVAPTF